MILGCMIILVIMLVFVSCTSKKDVAIPNTHTELVSLFREFRGFQKPKLVDNVPDYTPSAMAEQHRGLKKLKKRLAAMDVSDWQVSQQVDYHLVRAEMNGLDFYHRVLKPWRRDPVFYLFSQGGAGPAAYGRPKLGQLPLPSKDQTVLKKSHASGDLALIALYFLKDEILLYENLGDQLRGTHPGLLPAVEDALAAVKAYGVWLDENKASMTAPAGLGKENYNWYLKNVQLVPYTWDELWPSLNREYEHAITALKIEENKNRNRAPLKRVASNKEYHSRWQSTEKFLTRFVQENEIFTVPDYIAHYDPGTWWNTPGSGHALDLFEQCRDRDMLAEVVHNYLGHNLDGLRHARDDRPIRGQERLYAIDMIRSEGVAYGFEEFYRLAGMYEMHPRGKETHFIMKAFRVARGLADLKLHSYEFNLMESIQFCYDKTPRGWMLKDGFEAWYEMQTTLRFPGWHMGFNL